MSVIRFPRVAACMTDKVQSLAFGTGVGSGGYAWDLTPQLFMWRGY